MGVLCLADEAQKPPCKAGNQGHFWPEEANSSQDTARQFYQRGELEVCSVVVRKYKWEHVSVNVRDLAKQKHPSKESREPEAEKVR